MISNQYKTVEMNISQIKYFPIGSIWENDKLVRGVDYFETFSLRDSYLFSNKVSVVLDNHGNYIQEKFHPRIDTNSGRFSFASLLCIYENPDIFSFSISSHRAAFIAFPCYEIARFFLLSIGTYNDKLLNQFGYDANGNILSQYRNDEAANTIDNMRYFYPLDVDGNRVRNQLQYVDDDTDYDTEDIDPGMPATNYNTTRKED